MLTKLHFLLILLHAYLDSWYILFNKYHLTLASQEHILKKQSNKQKRNKKVARRKGISVSLLDT